MKFKLSLLIVFILILVNNLYSASLENETLKNETMYTKGTWDRTDCRFECPPFQDGYFGRVANIDVASGKTQCYVYKTDEPDVVLSNVTNVNELCKKAILSIEATEISSPITSSVSLENYNNLQNIEDKYYVNYINVGSGREFVNVPKYMIAGLTVDSEVIDVENTIKYNELTLNSNYTLYPNSTAFSEDSFREELQEDNWWITRKINNIRESLGLVELPEPSAVETLVHSNMVDSVKSILTNSVIFIMNFINENNEVMILSKTFVLFTVLPLTVGFAVMSKITKKLSEISDFDDVLERIVMGIATLFVFYFSTTNIETIDDKKISQSFFHQQIRPVFYKGAEIANYAGQSATKAYLKYKLRSVGLAPVETINESNTEILRIKEEQRILKETLTSQCYAKYNVDAMKQDLGVLIGLNATFPPEENITRYDTALEKDVKINFYGGFLTNPANITTNGLVSVSGCYKLERQYQENKSELEKLDYLVQSYMLTKENNVVQKQIEMIANMQFRNDAELGFLSMPLLATTTIMIDNIGVFDSPMGERINHDRVIKDFRQSGGYTVGAVAEDEGAIDGFINSVFSHLPYLMLPGADGLKTTIYDTLKGIKNTASSFIPITKVIRNINEKNSPTVAGKGNIGFWNMGRGLVKVANTGADAILYIISIFLTVTIMMYLLSYLPIIAIATASFSVIFFYYLSIELYYLVIPFLIAFAFSTNQSDLIKEFLRKGLILAFKPLLIVISVVLAIFAREFFDTLNTVLVNWQFEPMFALTKSVGLNNLSNLTDYAFADFGLIFFKGFLLIGNTVIAIVVVFYLVLNGANMILDIFGIRDGSFDAQNTIGANVDGKTNKWNTPI